MRSFLTRTTFNNAVLLFGSASFLIGCCPECPPHEGSSGPSTRQQMIGTLDSSDCRFGDLHRRAALYNKTGLETHQKNFNVRFKVMVNGSRVDIKNPQLRIPRSEITRVQDNIHTATGMTVTGMFVHYGMSGDEFKPVFEFMFSDPSRNGDLARIPAESYILSDTATLDKLDANTQKALLEAYRDDIRVDRRGSDKFEELLYAKPGSSPSEPDPLGEWFPYADHLNRLYAENKNGDHLVLTCISEQVCYSEIIGLIESVPEFRHLVAFHLAKGFQDLLDDGDITMATGYANRAMDLGHLCPPNCKNP